MLKTVKDVTALYCRTASAYGHGIWAQKALLLQYAEDQGLTSGEVVVFIDDGYSGLTFHRHSFLQMLEHIYSGEIKTVVAKDLTRYGRNWMDVYDLARRLREQYGVKLLTVKEGDFLEDEFGPQNLLAALEGGAVK